MIRFRRSKRLPPQPHPQTQRQPPQRQPQARRQPPQRPPPSRRRQPMRRPHQPRLRTIARRRRLCLPQSPGARRQSTGALPQPHQRHRRRSHRRRRRWPFQVARQSQCQWPRFLSLSEACACSQHGVATIPSLRVASHNHRSRIAASTAGSAHEPPSLWSCSCLKFLPRRG